MCFNNVENTSKCVLLSKLSRLSTSHSSELPLKGTRKERKETENEKDFFQILFPKVPHSEQNILKRGRGTFSILYYESQFWKYTDCLA